MCEQPPTNDHGSISIYTHTDTACLVHHPIYTKFTLLDGQHGQHSHTDSAPHLDLSLSLSLLLPRTHCLTHIDKCEDATAQRPLPPLTGSKIKRYTSQTRWWCAAMPHRNVRVRAFCAAARYGTQQHSAAATHSIHTTPQTDRQPARPHARCENIILRCIIILRRDTHARATHNDRRRCQKHREASSSSSSSRQCTAHEFRFRAYIICISCTLVYICVYIKLEFRIFSRGTSEVSTKFGSKSHACWYAGLMTFESRSLPFLSGSGVSGQVRRPAGGGRMHYISTCCGIDFGMRWRASPGLLCKLYDRKATIFESNATLSQFGFMCAREFACEASAIVKRGKKEAHFTRLELRVCGGATW